MRVRQALLFFPETSSIRGVSPQGVAYMRALLTQAASKQNEDGAKIFFFFLRWYGATTLFSEPELREVRKQPAKSEE